MNEIPKILESEEQMMWDEKPKYIPFIVPYLIGGLIILVLFFFVSLRGQWSKGAEWLKPLAPYLGIGISIFSVLWGHLTYKVTHYGITQKRVVFQSGVIGRDFKSVEYDKVQNVSVDVGLLDVLFKTGSIRIFSGEIGSTGGGVSMGVGGRSRQASTRMKPIYDILKHIPNPYNVLKMLQESLSERKEASLDVLKSIEEILKKKT